MKNTVLISIYPLKVMEGSQWLPRLIKTVWKLTMANKVKESDTIEKEINKSLLLKMGGG